MTVPLLHCIVFHMKMHVEALEPPYIYIYYGLPVCRSLSPGKGVISIRGAVVVDLPLVVAPASFSHKLRYECFTAHKALHVYILDAMCIYMCIWVYAYI